jgi:hypothetical protein
MISAANLSVAESLGSSDNSVASFQGSGPSRASAERTLSGISFISMPIGAWRKSSSSGLKKKVEEAGVTMATNGAMSPCGGCGDGGRDTLRNLLGWAFPLSYDRQRAPALRKGEAGPLKLGPEACGHSCRPHAARCMSTQEGSITKVRKVLSCRVLSARR